MRLAAGPSVDRLNRDLLRLAEAEKPDVLWTDKLLLMRPETLDKLRAMGIATVSYMIDNPFGPRRDPGWRLYMKDIPHYDLHVVQRDENIADYRERGARDVIKIQTAYEPTISFRRLRVGAMRTVIARCRLSGRRMTTRRVSDAAVEGVRVAGDGVGRRWCGSRHLSRRRLRRMYRGMASCIREEYREAIWRSKINLSFLTHSNQDEFVHKSFEIAGCGGFLLAERSEGHMQRFRRG